MPESYGGFPVPSTPSGSRDQPSQSQNCPSLLTQLSFRPPYHPSEFGLLRSVPSKRSSEITGHIPFSLPLYLCSPIMALDKPRRKFQAASGRGHTDPPAEYRSILFVQAGDRDPRTRRLIKSHVMLGKNRRTTKHETLGVQEPPLGQHLVAKSMSDGIPPAMGSGVAWASRADDIEPQVAVDVIQCMSHQSAQRHQKLSILRSTS